MQTTVDMAKAFYMYITYVTLNNIEIVDHIETEHFLWLSDSTVVEKTANPFDKFVYIVKGEKCLVSLSG